METEITLSIPNSKDKAGRNATLLESMALAFFVLEVVNDPSESASLWLILSASSANKRVAKLNNILLGESRKSPDDPGDLNLRILKERKRNLES